MQNIEPNDDGGVACSAIRTSGIFQAPGIAVVATAALWVGQGPRVLGGEPTDAWTLQRARQLESSSPLIECRHCVKQFPNSNVPASRQSAQGLTVSTIGTNRIPVLLVDFSTNIYIDNDLDGIQDQPVYNQPNRLFARVHNLGTAPAVNVIVDFYYANNASSWFSLPSGTNNPTAVPVSGSSGFFRTEIPAAPPSN